MEILLLVFFVQALKEIGIPSPGISQSLLLYAGYQFSRGELLLGIGMVVCAVLGGLCGAHLTFHLARLWGNQFLARMDRYVTISPAAIEKARQRVTTHSFLTVAVGRAIPGLMVPTSIVAGAARMPAGQFLLGTLFSLSLWIVLLTTLGGAFGHLAPQITPASTRFLLLLGALIAMGALAGAPAVRRWGRRTQKQPGRRQG